MKRVRKDVCHVWAHQLQSDARYGNIFFAGDTIYSYGRHFPMARHVKTKDGKHAVLFTTRGYSSSTSKHLGETRRAIPHGTPVFNVDDVTVKPGRKDLDSYKWRIDSKIVTCGRSRSALGTHIKELQQLVDEANAFAEAFGFKTRFQMPGDIDVMRAKAKKQAAEAKKRADAKQDKMIAEAQESLAKWIAGEPVRILNQGALRSHFLRIRDDMVETSLNAVVPLNHVKRAAPAILSMVRSGTPWHANGETIRMGNYYLTEITADGTVCVGCHRFSKQEIERFAALIGL